MDTCCFIFSQTDWTQPFSDHIFSCFCYPNSTAFISLPPPTQTILILNVCADKEIHGYNQLTSVVWCLHLSVPANIFRGAAVPPMVIFCGHWSISTRLKSTSMPEVPLEATTNKIRMNKGPSQDSIDNRSAFIRWIKHTWPFNRCLGMD